MKSRRGQLLIASQRLRDPNFFKSVVLLVKDDDDGALGVIINRPMEISVADACGEQVVAAEEITEPIHQGGPCEGPLSVLHANPAAGGEEVIDGVRFSMDKEDIEWLMANNKGPIKYFAGYSGWGAGQLQNEIDEGAWVIVRASAEHVFEKAGGWSKLNTWIALGKQIDIGKIPDDPSVN
jgi:putative transcriptional regulator